MLTYLFISSTLMLWTRTERLNPLGCTSPTISDDGHVLDGREHAVGDQYLPGAGVGAQPRGEIGDAADRRVVEAALETDPAERREALGDPDSQREIVTFAPPPRGKLAHGVADLQRHSHRTLRGVVVRDRVVEEHHDPVTGEPLERAFVFVDQAPRWPGDTRASTPITSSGSLVSANGVKFLQIGEEHDDLAAMALAGGSRRR